MKVRDLFFELRRVRVSEQNALSVRRYGGKVKQGRTLEIYSAVKYKDEWG